VCVCVCGATIRCQDVSAWLKGAAAERMSILYKLVMASRLNQMKHQGPLRGYEISTARGSAVAGCSDCNNNNKCRGGFKMQTLHGLRRETSSSQRGGGADRVPVCCYRIAVLPSSPTSRYNLKKGKSKDEILVGRI